MPRGDGTGPAGMGPMTGRAAGYCAGYSVPGFLNPYGGRYFGVGRVFFGGRGGRQRGCRNWYYATGLPGCYRYNIGMPAWGAVTAPPIYPYAASYQGPAFATDKEKEILKQQAEFLKQQLDDIQTRIVELEKESEEKEK